jgi:hypothetical protein
MVEESKNSYITEDEFKKFISCIPELDMYKNKSPRVILSISEIEIVFKLMYYCALKIQEVVDLEKEDFDLENKFLHLRNVNTNVKTTTIPFAIISELSDFLKTKQPHVKLFTAGRSTISINAKKIGEIAELKIFKSRSKQSIEGIHTLVFRDSYQQFMLENGAGSDLSNLKLRKTSPINYNNKTLDDLKHWESQLEYSFTYGVVILGDVLGTKGIWREKIPGEVIGQWSWLVEKTNDFLNSIFPTTKFSIRAFSDTLLITSTNFNMDTLIVEIGRFLNAFLKICIVYDFPIRGVFSLGNFVDSEQMIIGPAVDEAADVYEQSNWIGFSATPSAFSLIEKLSNTKKYGKQIHQYFIRYDIPLHGGTDKQNWAIKIDPNGKLTGDYEKNSKFKGMTIRDIADYKLQHPTGSESGIKWKNFLLFLNEMTPDSNS